MLSHDAIIYQRSGYTYAYRSDGKPITKAKTGADAAKLFKSAVDAMPDRGSIHIGRGVYSLSAPHEFQLDADGSNPFYCCVPVIDKSIHIYGAGPGSTVLQLMPGQRHPGRHVAMILARGTGPFTPGYDGFTVANMTIDGNRGQQTEGSPKDGESLILAGSKRSGGRYYNLRLIRSPGSGMYLGNNGGGYEDGALVHHVVAQDCAAEGIMLDTCQHSRVTDCAAWGCREGLHLHGDEWWATEKHPERSPDWVQVSGFQTDSPITVWQVRKFMISDVMMDCSTKDEAYGLVVRDSIGHVRNSVLVNDVKKTTSLGGATYIYGRSELELSGCHLEGYYGLHALGKASAVAQGCRLVAPGGCFYLADPEPVQCSVMAANCTWTGKRAVVQVGAAFSESNCVEMTG
ncbi:MAG TPA: hypothetical protein PLY74_10810 [Methanothrix soehngenii]|nr:hypothetical protein [Methanothrix soehngenii]